jgi:DNA polymerase-3 subunit delta'
MQFKDIPGLHDLKKTLLEAYHKNHIAHAQLFSGKPGSANTALAIAFITYILCENKTSDDSCNECGNCQKMRKYIHPDVHFFYPSSKVTKEAELNTQLQSWRDFLIRHPFGVLDDWVNMLQSENKVNQISKEDARRLIRTVSLKSFEGGMKFLLIWYPETMHPSAANAILKVLEEPPPNTIYFLITYDYESLITTILSRTQLIVVPSLSEDEIKDYLVVHKGISEQNAMAVAKQCDGDINYALKSSEEFEDIDFRIFQKWMRSCFAADFGGLVKMNEDFHKMTRSGQRSFLNFSIGLIRGALFSSYEPTLVKSVSEQEQLFVAKFGETLKSVKLEKVYRLLNGAISDLSRNANPRITFLSTSLKISQIIRQ